MTQDELKQASAEAAMKYLEPDAIVGVGTGSTVNYFIDLLANFKSNIEAAVASSVATEKLLRERGIPVIDLNSTNRVDIYVDGADEANEFYYLIKGRGGALTREKIVAATANKFVCIIDQTKWVKVLGSNAALPIEVIPMARSFVGREIVKMGANPVYRDGFTTDNGNIIIDAYGLNIMEPLKLEQTLNNIPGVVENGLFAHRPADVLLIASESGVTEKTK